MSHMILHARPAFPAALTASLAALVLMLTLPAARADTQRPPDRSNPAPAVAPDDPLLLRKIDPPLRKRLLTAAPGERIPIIVEMRQQTDLTQVPLAAARAQRAEATVNALQATAFQSQLGVRSFLIVEMAAGRASDIRPFWIFNGLSAHASVESVAALAARGDVGLVREDRYRQWITDWRIDPSTVQLTNPLTTSAGWNIAKVRADEVWAALNISGTGVVVANMDTGVDWQHPALQAAYRGYARGLVNHSGNWFDATDAQTTYPIDPFGHGTHTMGTIVGSGGIGVAPGARWIAIRIFDASGSAYDSWIHAGFQWAIAPNDDLALAPDVLNNSWGSSASADTTFQNDLRVLRRAGVFAVFSNGNNGPVASTVGSPASLPEAFAAGATDIDDVVALFSSRGPSPWGEVRPHLSAPGVNVLSSVPGGGYAKASGTSMAAPHAAGTIALMLSAAPFLTITSTASALTGTAVPLSVTIPNNNTGYGRLDAYAAVQSVAHAGFISGSVTRSDTAAPIAGATVTMLSSGGAAASATTDVNGRYARSLAPSIYTATVSAFGYVAATRLNMMVITGATTRADFALTPLPAGSLVGSLIDAQSGQPISGTIFVVNTPVAASANGVYNLALPGGAFEVRAVAWKHRVITASVTITPGQVATRDFALPPAPSVLLVDSGVWYNASQIGYYRAALDDLGYVYHEHRVANLSTDAPVSSTLTPYDVVIWSAPLDAPGYIGASDAISQYLSSGRSLFISGQDIGFWDGGLGSYWFLYYHDRLKAIAVADDSDSRSLAGQGIFSGLNVAIDSPDGANNQAYPDAIRSVDPTVTADAFVYSNGNLGGQSVGLCLPYRAEYFSFGFEAIGGAAARREVMSRTLAYFASPRNAVGMTLAPATPVLIGPAGSRVTQTLTLRNIAELGGPDTLALSVQSPGWDVSLSTPSVTLDPCRTQVVTVSVAIPPGIPVNAARSITVTARSTHSPALTVSASFVAKAPAATLLVDDDRWYDVKGAYQTALISDGISFDLYRVSTTWAGFEPSTPSPAQLGWYPFIIWFTGYDWYQPLTASNEVTLTQYLDAGGRVLISAQDYLGVSGLSNFGRGRLGVLDWAEDMTTTLARGVPGGPFDGIGSLSLHYPFPNYSDALAPYPTATIGLVGSHGRPIALTHERGPGKTMFLSFPFEAILDPDRPTVMDRIAGYLSWLGSSVVTADQAVVTPGSDITVQIVAHNDGPAALASASLTAALPAALSLQSGSTAWSGPLAQGQSITATFVAGVGGGAAPGSVVTIPVTFADNDHAIAFHRTARVGIARPDLSASQLSVQTIPAHPSEVVTWRLIARNTGLADAPSAAITGLLPIKTQMMTGTLTSSIGSASELSGTVQWRGPIPAGGRVSITYQMSVPLNLVDRLYYGGALFDDGGLLNRASTWLAVQPYRFYFPLVFKSGRP